MTWRSGGNLWGTCRKYSQSTFSLLISAVHCIWHFLMLLGGVYVLFESWRKFSAFPLIPQQSSFFLLFFSPSEPSLNFLWSDHLRLWIRKSKCVLIFVWSPHPPYPPFLVPASLSGAFAPSAWNSSGHREAAGLSFVSSNHSYWFGVWSNYGGFVWCRRKAHCIYSIAQYVAARELACFWGFVLFDHCTGSFSLLGKALFWNGDLQRMLFSSGVQVDDTSWYSQQSSREAVISIVFPPAPVLQGEFCQILTAVNDGVYVALVEF